MREFTAPYQEEEPIKLPFNDRKHIPTRPEIDLLLGMLPAIELKRFEDQIILREGKINWSMFWYEYYGGWGYRASFKSHVLVVLHFYKGYFTATVSIPLASEHAYLEARELTPAFHQYFAKGKLAPKAKFVTCRIWKRKDVEALLSLMERKLQELRAK